MVAIVRQSSRIESLKATSGGLGHFFMSSAQGCGCCHGMVRLLIFRKSTVSLHLAFPVLGHGGFGTSTRLEAGSVPAVALLQHTRLYELIELLPEGFNLVRAFLRRPRSTRGKEGYLGCRWEPALQAERAGAERTGAGLRRPCCVRQQDRARPPWRSRRGRRVAATVSQRLV